MRLLRKIFFYIFTMIYVGVCPFIILYAFGFIFKPGGNTDNLVKTGIIYLSSAPAGACIYLADKLYPEKTPAVIRGLLPGAYQIKVKIKDHLPWVRNLRVEASKAAVLDTILLVPERWKRAEAAPGIFSDIIPVEGGRSFLIKKGDKLGEHCFYDIQSGTLIPLVGEGSRYAGAQVREVIVEDRSPTALMEVEAPDGEKYILTRKKGQRAALTDITELFQDKPLDVFWEGDLTRIFGFYGTYINMLEVSEEAVYPKYIRDIKGYGAAGHMVYALSSENIFYRVEYGRKNKEVLFSDPDIGNSLFGADKTYRIRPLSRKVIIFMGSDGELLANQLPYKFVDKGVIGTAFDGDRDKLIFWKKDRIGTIDFAGKEQTLNEGFEKGPELKWLYSGGADIRQVFWVYGGDYALFRDGEDVYIADLESSGRPEINHILKVRKGSSISYFDEAGKLFYVDQQGRFSSIEIIPQRELIYAAFPEEWKDWKKGDAKE